MREQFQQVFREPVDLYQLQENLGFSNYTMSAVLKGHVWAMSCRRFLSQWQTQQQFPSFTVTRIIDERPTLISSSQDLVSLGLMNQNSMQAYLHEFLLHLSAKELVLLPPDVSRNILDYLKHIAEEENNGQRSSFEAALQFGTQFATVLWTSAWEKSSEHANVADIMRNSMPLLSDIAHMPIIFAEYIVDAGYEISPGVVKEVSGNIVNYLGISGVRQAGLIYALVKEEKRPWKTLLTDKKWNTLAFLMHQLESNLINPEQVVEFLSNYLLQKDTVLVTALEMYTKMLGTKEARFIPLNEQINLIAHGSHHHGGLRLNPDLFVFDEQSHSFIAHPENHYEHLNMPEELLNKFGKPLVDAMRNFLRKQDITWSDFKTFLGEAGYNPGCGALVSLLSHGALDDSSKAYLKGMPAHTIGFLSATLLHLIDNKFPPKFKKN